MYSFNKDRRIDLPEKMDQPGVTQPELMLAHSEIKTINRFLGGHAVLTSGLKMIDQAVGFRSLIDVGCGAGENLRVINQKFLKKIPDLRLKGIDNNADVICIAELECLKMKNISFDVADVFDDFGKADVISCSLFCHHFTDDKLINLIRKLYRSSNKAVLINDLHRHWFAYHSIGALTRAFSRSHLVRYDAPLSVARSFTRADWERILSDAGVKSYDLTWKWAWRWQLIIWK